MSSAQASSYSAVGCEFNVKESTIHIKEGAFKHKYNIKQSYVLIDGWKCHEQGLTGT